MADWTFALLFRPNIVKIDRSSEAALLLRQVRPVRSHTMFISLFPNWVGQTQPRVVKIEGNTLHLSTAVPIHSSSKVVSSYLVWERARPQ